MADPIEDFSPASVPPEQAGRLDLDLLRRLATLEQRVRDVESGLDAARREITEDQNVTRHFRASVGNLIERSNALMNEYTFMQRSRSAFLLAFRTALTAVIDVLRTFRDTAASARLDDASEVPRLLADWSAPPSVAARLKAANFLTLGQIAFAIPPDAPIDQFLVSVLGVAEDHSLMTSPEAAVLCRLVILPRLLPPASFPARSHPNCLRKQ
ncbi:unnamed protein product [Symbiodinium sp. CCMP2456]|nr:unnamed protein product [Symbiodinium sp. CCMP2456]